ncbi:hypothetical protein TWF281_006598 [Arthrobotrys megalospora]
MPPGYRLIVFFLYYTSAVFTNVVYSAPASKSLTAPVLDVESKPTSPQVTTTSLKTELSSRANRFTHSTGDPESSATSLCTNCEITPSETPARTSLSATTWKPPNDKDNLELVRKPKPKEHSHVESVPKKLEEAGITKRVVPSDFYTVLLVCPLVRKIVWELNPDPESYMTFQSAPQRRPDPAFDVQAATHFFIAMRALCEKCACEEDTGNMIPTDDECVDSEKVDRCKNWLQCRCEARMNSKLGKLDGENFVKRIRAMDGVPDWIKKAHHRYAYSTGKGAGTGVSWGKAAAINRKYPKKESMVKDTAEPYYLEGPGAVDDGPYFPVIPDDVDDERWMQKEVGDTGLTGFDMWPFVVGDVSGGLFKRDVAELEHDSEDSS